MSVPLTAVAMQAVEASAFERYARLAMAVCNATQAMLLRMDPHGAATLAGAEGFAAPPPDPGRILRLHLDHGGQSDMAVVARLPADADAAEAGAEMLYCGVALHDHSKNIIGLLCVLREAAGARGFGASARRAMLTIGQQFCEADLFASQAGLRELLVGSMTELAWLCDSRGSLIWRNRAFTERFGLRQDGGREGAAFVARCRLAGEGEHLTPSWTQHGHHGWFRTRLQTVHQDGSYPGGWPADGARPQFGLATEATAEIDRRMAPVAPTLEVAGCVTLALGSVVEAIAERIRGMLGRGVTLRVQGSGADQLAIRADPRLLEAALLDAALACVPKDAQPGAPSSATDTPTIVLWLEMTAEHAVLSMAGAGLTTMVDPLALMPMVRKLLDACNGRAEPGMAPQRPELRLLLPLYRPPQLANVPAAARILVVDDEPVVRMLVVDLLRERGHAVQEAEDAFIAMARLQDDNELDLMITDIGLPGGFDGSTLARRARQLHPELPILFITGYAFGTNNDVTLEPGIPVLTKPFTLSALSTRIADLLHNRVGAAPRAVHSGH